jgi:predicted amidophosphoribosyltransferase
MANLIRGEECILIPVPDCCGFTGRNLRLAQAIAVYAECKAQVMDILTRCRATESQCDRHCKGEAALSPEELNITVRPHKLFTLKQVYFVDNVTTSGATIQACRDALGFGTGLVYAEAMARRR